MTREYPAPSEAERYARYEKLVPYVYHRIAYSLDPGLDQEDYLQEGRIGLLRALRQGDTETRQFLSYAFTAIANAMRMASRQLRKAPHGGVSLSSPLTNGDDLTVADVIADPAAEDMLDAVEWQAMPWRRWAKAILTPALYRVWAATASSGDPDPAHHAAALGMPRRRAQQYHAKARMALRRHRQDLIG